MRSDVMQKPQPTTGPWRVDVIENAGHNWQVADLGEDEEGQHYIVTTDHVHASEYGGDPKGDAEFIVWARNNLGLLWQLYVEHLERQAKEHFLEPLHAGPAELSGLPLLGATAGPVSAVPDPWVPEEGA